MSAKSKGTRNEHRSVKLLEAASYRCCQSAARLDLWDIVVPNAATETHRHARRCRWLQETMSEHPAPLPVAS